MHNALALPILLYGSEIWTIRRKEKRRLTSIEITIFQKSRIHPFWPQREWRNFVWVESRTSWRETKKI